MFIVIIETAKDSLRDDQKDLPPDYPTLCKEYESLELARAEYPDKVIMTAEQYRGYSWGLELLYAHVEKMRTEAELKAQAEAEARAKLEADAKARAALEAAAATEAQSKALVLAEPLVVVQKRPWWKVWGK